MRHQKSPNEYAGTLKGADLRASGRGAPPCPASIAWMAASLAAIPTALIREVGGRSTARPTRSTRPANPDFQEGFRQGMVTFGILVDKVEV
jgi:hypothetical protein